MNSIKKLILNCWLIGCLLVGTAHIAVGAPVDNRPPKMPTFDSVAVQTMLSSVDEGYNYPVLKIGYFGGRIRAPFPATKGFLILKNSLNKQKVGSLQWFQLESLRGFAAFHVQGIPATEGYDAYGVIFGGAFLATTPQTKRAVQISIRDFVVSVFTSLGRKGLSDDSRTQNLLLKAWHTWNSLPRTALSLNLSLDWGRTVEAAYAEDKFIPIVEKALKDAKVTPSFQTLKLAIIVFKDKDKPRAIKLLKTTQKRLEPGNLYQQRWLYATWAELITNISSNKLQVMKLTDKKQLAEFVEMRNEQISYTGTGYDDLLKLYWKLEETDKAAALIKTAQSPGIPQKAKVAIGTTVLSPPREMHFDKDTTQHLQLQGIALLQSYLKMPKKQNLRTTLQARVELGRYFVKQDMITQAMQALDISDVKPPPPHTQTAMYYEDILQMKTKLKKKLKDVSGVR